MRRIAHLDSDEADEADESGGFGCRRQILRRGYYV
jgi:hypothetical protein